MRYLVLLSGFFLGLWGLLFAQVPEYNIGIPPTQVMQSWYDYMPGGYYDLPMVQFSLIQGGGGMFAYHARLGNAGNPRKVYFAYFDGAGQLQPVVVPWQDESVTMGFPSVSFDNTLNRTLYAWHETHDTDSGLEVVFVHESDPIQFPGLYSNRFVVFDPPLLPPGHENDEFIWPSLKTGPSPNPGMRRVYILARNASETTAGNPGTNVMIAYADYDANALQETQNLVWSYTSIPQLDAWQNDSGDIERRFFGSFAVGNDGKIYYAGYHVASDQSSNTTVQEPDLDVFVCDNYGAGTWQHYSFSSKVPSYNPWSPWLISYAFYYQDPPVAIPDEEIYYRIVNSTHNNLTIDSEGKLHYPGLWSLCLGNYDYPTSETTTVKEFIFDPLSNEMSIHEIFPVAQSSSDNQWWMPWDADGDLYADSWPWPNPLPDMVYHFPYSHWDTSMNFDAMMFHYNYVRLTGSENDGRMACIWQDSYKARSYNLHPDEFPQYAPFANDPEVYLAVSPDNGRHWHQPIVLSAVDTPAFSGRTPMWFYPSDTILPFDNGGTDIWKRLYLMFMDDNDWGWPGVPSHVIDWGNIMYMALDVQIPTVAVQDEAIPAITGLNLSVSPNPFGETCDIHTSLPSKGSATMAIYNLRGQLVRRIEFSSLPAGEAKLVWDGKDNKGMCASSGIYFIRIDNGKNQGVSKALKLN